ncbi:elongation factor G [Rhodobacteraceae bacterium M382]|nr:elongation factor G [Rhodobacteraceae bacterium M382]
MRVFTILGPSHSGKSTLAATLAGLDDTPHQTLDISGTASVHTFSYMGEDWGAIDIAGGAENLCQAGPALAASDAAVLCVPADAEAAVLSAPFIRLIEEAGIPAFLFINKVDVATDRLSDIVMALQSYCGHNIVLRQVPMRDGDHIVGAVDLISERAWEYHDGEPSTLIEIPSDVLNREQEARTELLEAYSDFDDTLLEQLIEDKQPMADDVFDVATQVLQHNDLVPALIGSALHRNGMTRIMKSLRHEAPGIEATCERLTTGKPPQAVGCAADLVKHLGKTIVVRALGGPVNSNTALAGGSIGNLTAVGSGQQIQELAPGQLGVAAKSDQLSLGWSYDADGASALPGWASGHPSTYRRLITPLSERDETRLTTALDKLSEIDPAAQVSQDEQTGHAVLSCQGPQHLRRLIAMLEHSFGIKTTQEQLPPTLRETITKSVEHRHRHRKQSGGAGQFADVVIELAPQTRGAGFRFDEIVKGGAVPRNYIPSVESGARDALAKGPVGFPVVDVSVTLKDGKHHSVDSSDYAFRTAGRNAVNDAMATAAPVLLQPIMKIDIHVPSSFTGALVPVISGMKGQVLGFEAHPTAAGWDVFNTLLPMSALDDLANALASNTRGTAWYTSDFDHYQETRKEDFGL